MPDLSPSAIDVWLSEHGSAAIADAGTGMDSQPVALPHVLRLGNALDDALERSRPATEAFLAAFATGAHLRPVMSGLGSARRLRMLHWLSDSGFKDPRALVERVTAPAPDGTGQGIRRWLLDLQRRELLAAIFDPDRINLLLAACRETAQTET